MQTIFQEFGVEIYQQTDLEAAQTKIGQHLRYMHGQKVLHRLYFEQYGVLHHDIGTVAAWQTDALVDQREGRLPNKCQATLPKLPAKALLVHLFQQTRPQRSMNFYRQSNDLPGAIPGQTAITFFFVKACLKLSCFFVRHLAASPRTVPT
jgi:hypothetical protein